MLEEGIPKIWKFIKKVIKQWSEKLEKNRKKNIPQKDRKTEELLSQAQGTRSVPGDTKDRR